MSPSIVTYRCDGCGDGYIVQEGEKADHVFVDIVNNPATCVTKGYLVRQCSVCGVIETQQTDPDPNAHQYVLYYDGKSVELLPVQCMRCNKDRGKS